MDKQREMFEDWQLDTGRTDPLHLGYIEDKGRYALNVVQGEWEVWQAAQKVQWQPIETAPKDGTRILISRSELVEPVTIGYWSMVECRFVTPMVFDYHAPTHWMPLPPEPNK